MLYARATAGRRRNVPGGGCGERRTAGRERRQLSPDPSPDSARDQCRVRARHAALRIEAAVARIVAGSVREQRLFLNQIEQRRLTREIVDDMVRLGPLQALMDDIDVSDIMVNGPRQVFVERHGRLQATEQRFRDAEHLMNLAQRIASGVGRRIDEASPMVDARLPDGSRVNIIAPPLALDGACISIRKFARQTITLDRRLPSSAASSPRMGDFAHAARARLNILVSGGTGSGKTTLLNALSQHIDPQERIVTIEDAAELRLQQPHVVRLETQSL